MVAGGLWNAVAIACYLGWSQEPAPQRERRTPTEHEAMQVAALRKFVIDSCPHVGHGYPGGCVVTFNRKNTSASVRAVLSQDGRVQPSEPGDFEFVDGGTGAFRRRQALIVDLASLVRSSARQAEVRIALLSTGLGSRECSGRVLRDANGRWALDEDSLACTIS